MGAGNAEPATVRPAPFTGRMNMTRKEQQAELAKTAMHGILCACASPQFADRIYAAAGSSNMTPQEYIAGMAINQANAMQKHLST